MVLSLSKILLLLLTYFSFTKNRIAIAVYLFIYLFLPNEIEITKIFDISAHKAAYLIFFIYVIQINRFSKYNPMKLGYIILVLSLIVPYFNNNNNEGNIYYNFFIYFIPNLILPSLLLFYGIETVKDLKVIFLSFIILILTWSIYGAFEFLTSSNPFIDSLIKEFPLRSFSVSKGYEYTDSIRLGSISRLQCTVWHPIAFGIRINIILSILLYFKINYSNIFFHSKLRIFIFFYLPTILVLLMSFLTVSRSVWLDSILILFLYWKTLINDTVFKKIILVILSIILFFNINELIEFINNYLLNPFEGSSFAMRFSQISSVLDLLKNNFIFGLGLGFVQNFILINSLTTDLFGFESILFTTIIESGFIGLFSLIIFLTFIRKSILHKTLNYNKSINILFIPFIITIILTGEMQNLSTFSLLMTILYSINLSITKYKNKVK